MSRPPLFYYSKAYTFSQENHTSLLFLFFFPQFFEVISHTQLDCDLCLLQNQTSSIELSFSLSTTHAEKGKIQIFKNLYLPPFFSKYIPKKITALKKTTGVFKKNNSGTFFYQTFIFCHAFSLTKEFQKKHSERRAILSFVQNMGGLGVPILLHSTNIRELTMVFKRKDYPVVL